MENITFQNSVTTINASTVIFGFTGPIGSGSTYISKGLADEYSSSSFKYFQLSDIIRESLISEGISKPTTDQMQNKGNELREKERNGYLVQRLFEKINQTTPIEGPIIIDGIKNKGEIDTLRQFPHFYLFSVHADRDVRKTRCLRAEKLSSDEFDIVDKRDEFEDQPNGQQVKICNDLSDIIVLNNTDIPKVGKQRKQQFIQNVYNRYIDRILQVKKGSLPIENLPDVNELCMTIAYALSKKSSCIKRKVGAIIVDIEAIENGDWTIHNDFPYILSSGYNDVPIGSQICALHSDIQNCQRDYIQEQEGKKLLYCPSCGEKIDMSIICICGKKYSQFSKRCTSCGRELKIDYKCKCGKEIYKEFLPGGSHRTGKLLDMCRAMHAEEIAILNLSGNINSKNRLVLFTTTYPCNLCANKIVAAGIKKVVYAEPYTMEEAREILERAKVKLERFEGIKSSAYFRIYS